MWRYSLFLTAIFSSQVLSHADNQPGPHDGIIRMPGAFHTEVIPQNNGIRVMLLDMQFDGPTTINSSVKAIIQTEAGEWSFICKPKEDYFFCPIDTKLLESKGTLQILAQRQNMQGAPADYPLPLGE